MSQMTSFGRIVKRRLVTIGMPQKTLIEEVKKRTGMYCDYKVLSRAFAGMPVHERIVNAIIEILDIRQKGDG